MKRHPLAALALIIASSAYLCSPASARDFHVRVPILIDTWLDETPALVRCLARSSDLKIVAVGIASIPIEQGAHEGTIEVVVEPQAGNADVEAASITCFLEAGRDYLLLTREECQIAGLIEAGYGCVPSHIRFRSEVSISINPNMQD